MQIYYYRDIYLLLPCAGNPGKKTNLKIMTTLLKKNYLWIILFGTLIGLNEALIGSMNLPYRSVVLSTITIVLLALARSRYPQRGTSLIIIAIAFLFKINNMGIQDCTAPALLCGPTALLLLGIGFEIFASLMISPKRPGFVHYVLTCAYTSVVVFGIFALLQTYILKSWDSSRLLTYTFVRGSQTALISGAVCLAGLYSIRSLKNVSLPKLHPFIVKSLLFSVIVALWFLGS
jgi:hypothetical protein